MTSQSLLTAGEVASVLNVAVKTIRQWVYRRRIPYIKINGAVRFDRQAIDQWIQAGSRGESA